MPALCLFFVATALTLILVAPAAAQRNPDLVRDLQDDAVQRALIAAGTLDAVAGRATWWELRKAITQFRKAHPQFKDGLEPLTDDERRQLGEISAKFQEWAGLEKRLHEDPTTKLTVWLRLPTKFVKAAYTEINVGRRAKWLEYQNMKQARAWPDVAIGPEIYKLEDVTPVSLFTDRIMSAGLTYKRLHLTSEEFAAQGEGAGYYSYNLVVASGDLLKGLFMRYDKEPPGWFDVPDFVRPMLAVDPQASEEPEKTRGWQLLMRAVTNLVASDFPFDNDWQKASSKECPVPKAPETTRILFGTDRALKPGVQRAGGPADADALFGTERAGQLYVGCLYVSRPKDGSNLVAGIDKHHLIYPDETKVDPSGAKKDAPGGTKRSALGDQLILTDEFGEDSEMGPKGNARSDALLFIHGYNVGFKDALASVSKLVWETDYKGRVYMYSWPSVLSTARYVQDLDNSEQAEPYFQSFMRVLMRDANVYKIDVLAHSMGSQTLIRAVSALRPIFETRRWGGEYGGRIRIGQMIFAAPDVATSVFAQKIDRIAPYADRITVYVSSTDVALLASKVLRGGVSRLGDLADDGDPALIDNEKVHIIDATGNERWYRVDRIIGRLFTGFGHDYFTAATPVTKDIKDIITANQATERLKPDERAAGRFQKKFYRQDPTRPYWKLIQ